MSRRARKDRNDDGAGLARLLLRGALGGTMIAHGVRHARTQDGTAGWFESLGWRRPRLQAQLSSTVEIGSGAALLAGAGTPMASSAVVGTMVVAYQTVHRPNGYFVVKEGWEYVAFVAASAVALAALGAGRFSVDRVLGLDGKGRPAQRAALAAGLGLAGAGTQLATFWRRPAG
jgi:putative oxidoreductase